MGNENEEDQQHHQHHQQQQQQQQQQLQAADIARGIRRRRTLQSVLDRQDEFPSRQRNKIDALVEEFLTDLGDDIHDMLCDENEGD